MKTDVKAATLARDLQHFRIGQAAFMAKAIDWCAPSYLIINFNIEELRKRTALELPAESTKLLAKEVYAYIYENKMPPDEIMSVVLNVAEDVVAERTPELRAGDYIAFQEYVRNTAQST